MQSEAAPLLGPGLHREAQYDGMEDRSNSSEEVLPKTNSEIFKFIFTTAYPIACALVLEITCNFIMLFFASRVRNSDIPAGRIFAGVSLATMFANVTCFSIHEGMTGAVEVEVNLNLIN